MSLLFIPPVVRATDSNGTIIPGAKWYFYETGTLNLTPVYTDASLSTPHTNPVIADASALFPPIYLDPAVVYRATQKTAGDVEIEDIDPINSATSIAGREQLTADRTYYVRTDGSDSTTGLSNTSAGAFLTIQKAINAAYALDCAGHKVTIRVATGTYTGQISIVGPLLNPNSTPLEIIGDETTPTNVLISTVGDSVHLSHGAYVLLAGMKLTSSTGGLMVCDYHSTIEHRNMNMGNATASGGAMFTPHYNGVIRALGPTTISGNADSCCHVTTGGLVYFSSQTINFTGAPNTFAVYLWGINNGSVYLDSATITWTQQPTGGITVHDRSILNVASLTGNYMPTGGITHVDNGSTIMTGLLILRELYVDASAPNDNTDGLTASRPFKTIQGCANFWSQHYYDPEMWATNTQPVNINLAAGTYSETVKLYDLPWLAAMIIGADKATTTINGVSDAIIGIGGKTLWSVQKVKLTAAAGACLRADMGANIDFADVNFGSATVAHIQCNSGGKIRATGSYTISAGSVAHIRLRMGMVDYGNFTTTVTLSGSPAFSDAFIRADQSSSVYCSCSAGRVTFSGSMGSGLKYNLRLCSTLDTDGNTAAIPGASTFVDATSRAQ